MKFVSKQIRAIVLCNPTVHNLTQKIHAYENRGFLVFFLPASSENCHRHVNGFGDIPFISLLCDRAESFKKNLFHTISNLGKATLNLCYWELLA